MKIFRKLTYLFTYLITYLFTYSLAVRSSESFDLLNYGSTFFSVHSVDYFKYLQPFLTESTNQMQLTQVKGAR